MHPLIVDHLSRLEFGELQEFNGMAVVPLFLSTEQSPDYLTLKEGLEQNLLKVEEVNEGGVVPELKVTNTAPVPVLTVNGEEVIGAKQNRVLNASILLKEKSETVIPVSCTEHGRWAYVARLFADSDVVMASDIRAYKMSSVLNSLKGCQGFRSNQSGVWDKITHMSLKMNVKSPTGAMKAVFTSKKEDLDKYLNAFKCNHSQKGLLVLVNGEAMGMDFVSRDSAFEVLHPKLVRSYALQALHDTGKEASKPSIDKAKDFLNEIMACNETRYESTGYGWDYRYESSNIIGSALEWDNHVIHMAFFKITSSEKPQDVRPARAARTHVARRESSVREPRTEPHS